VGRIPFGQAANVAGECHHAAASRDTKVRGINAGVIEQFVGDVGLQFLIAFMDRLCHVSTMAHRRVSWVVIWDILKFFFQFINKCPRLGHYQRLLGTTYFVTPRRSALDATERSECGDI
jgi:hypothetical protein